MDASALLKPGNEFSSMVKRTVCKTDFTFADAELERSFNVFQLDGRRKMITGMSILIVVLVGTLGALEQIGMPNTWEGQVTPANPAGLDMRTYFRMLTATYVVLIAVYLACAIVVNLPYSGEHWNRASKGLVVIYLFVYVTAKQKCFAIRGTAVVAPACLHPSLSAYALER